MEKVIRSVNFGDMSKQYFKKENEIIEEVDDTFDPNSIEVLDEYNLAVDTALEGGKVIFVTGKAGTGKSTLIKYVKHQIPKSVVVAPTSIAAQNVKGSTIHSFFGLPPKMFNPEDLKCPQSKMPVIQDLDLLIVDEISMVNAAVIDGMNIIMQQAKNNALPFGGISIMFVGDLFQLPPIVEDEEQRKYFSGDNGRYDSEFFISADIFKTDIGITPIELKKVRRQSEEDDNDFVEALNSIRIDSMDVHEHLEDLNKKCYKEKQDDDFEDSITLAPSKTKVRGINKDRLDAIESESRMYKGKLKGLTSEDIKQFQAPDELELKVGAQVVFLDNNKPDWINGDLGKVVKMEDDFIEVMILKTGYVREVTRSEFGKYKYHYNVDKKKIEMQLVGKFIQFPLAPGWAITIHKSQGMTLEKAVVEIGGSAFAKGQTYVALSRVTSMDGLKLLSELSYGDVQIDQGILGFYQHLFGGEYHK